MPSIACGHAVACCGDDAPSFSWKILIRFLLPTPERKVQKVVGKDTRYPCDAFPWSVILFRREGYAVLLFGPTIQDQGESGVPGKQEETGIWCYLCCFWRTSGRKRYGWTFCFLWRNGFFHELRPQDGDKCFSGCHIREMQYTAKKIIQLYK